MKFLRNDGMLGRKRRSIWMAGVVRFSGLI
jgi:hypothetical protein